MFQKKNMNMYNNDDKWLGCVSDSSDGWSVFFRDTNIRSVSSIAAEGCLIGNKGIFFKGIYSNSYN